MLPHLVAVACLLLQAAEVWPQQMEAAVDWLLLALPAMMTALLLLLLLAVLVVLVMLLRGRLFSSV